MFFKNLLMLMLVSSLFFSSIGYAGSITNKPTVELINYNPQPIQINCDGFTYKMVLDVESDLITGSFSEKDFECRIGGFTKRQPKITYEKNILSDFGNKVTFEYLIHTDFFAGEIDIVPVIKGYSYPEHAWYNSIWSYSKSIQIDYTQVDSTETNFPVLVNITSDVDLKNNVTQADGGDIIFINQANDSIYPHELEQWNSTGNGDLCAWVNVSTVNSSGSNTVFNMYYGNSTIANQWNIEDTWDKNVFLARWGLTNLSDSCGLYDLTGYGNPTQSSEGGSFGGCYDLDSDDALYHATLLDTMPDTVSFFVRAQSKGWDAGALNVVMGKVNVISEDHLEIQPYDKKTRFYAEGSAQTNQVIITNVVMTDNQWYLFGLGHSEGTRIHGFIDNKKYENIGTATIQDINTGSAGDFLIGANFDDGVIKYFLDGYVDEVRLYKTKVTDSYMLTTANMFANASLSASNPFLIMGNQMVKPSLPASNNVSYLLNLSFVNGSIIYPCEIYNITAFVGDINGDVVTWSIECNGDSDTSTAVNDTVLMNFTDYLFVNTNYTVFINLSDGIDNNNTWFWFTTQNEFCNTIKESDSMVEVTLGIDSTLLFTLLLSIVWLVFVVLHFRYKYEAVIGWIQFLTSMPLTFVFASMANGFIMGYAFTVIIPIFSIVILMDSYDLLKK